VLQHKRLLPRGVAALWVKKMLLIQNLAQIVVDVVVLQGIKQLRRKIGEKRCSDINE